MADKYRYVEVCSTDGDHWRAVLPAEPMGTRAAEEVAREDAAQAWGLPIDQIDVFVTRALTPEKHALLVAAAKRGTLNPDWWLGKRHHVEMPS